MTKRNMPENVSLRIEKKGKKRERRILRWKKTAVFLIVMGGTLGVFQVDQAYSDMCGAEPKLPPQISRQEDGLFQLSFLGMQAELNVKEIGQVCQAYSKKAEEGFLAFYSSLLHLLHLDGEKKGSPFQRQPHSKPPMQVQLI